MVGDHHQPTLVREEIADSWKSFVQGLQLAVDLDADGLKQPCLVSRPDTRTENRPDRGDKVVAALERALDPSPRDLSREGPPPPLLPVLPKNAT